MPSAMDSRDRRWENDKNRDSCSLCQSKFTLLFRRHHCRACGSLICADCSIFQQLDDTRVRICQDCLHSTLACAPPSPHTTAIAPHLQVDPNAILIELLAEYYDPATSKHTHLREGEACWRMCKIALTRSGDLHVFLDCPSHLTPTVTDSVHGVREVDPSLVVHKFSYLPMSQDCAVEVVQDRVYCLRFGQKANDSRYISFDSEQDRRNWKLKVYQSSDR